MSKGIELLAFFSAGPFISSLGFSLLTLRYSTIYCGLYGRNERAEIFLIVLFEERELRQRFGEPYMVGVLSPSATLCAELPQGEEP